MATMQPLQPWGPGQQGGLSLASPNSRCSAPSLQPTPVSQACKRQPSQTALHSMHMQRRRTSPGGGEVSSREDTLTDLCPVLGLSLTPRCLLRGPIFRCSPAMSQGSVHPEFGSFNSWSTSRCVSWRVEGLRGLTTGILCEQSPWSD